MLGHTDETDGIYRASEDSPVIIFDDFTTSFHWVNFDFKVKSSAIKMLKLKKNTLVNFRFVFYAMKCIRYLPANHVRHWISIYSKFCIPIPPLNVQNTIVEILDKFDALVNDISVGLPAELAARRMQYEYCRNKLLTFSPLEEHACGK